MKTMKIMQAHQGEHLQKKIKIAPGILREVPGDTGDT